ncbi:hypothetical protein AB0A74_40645 [Saccharothrix sp. NPDC042600]|uniref:hypothetical protein n=1 Tax=Saccharothrix sp. NPDC042600 TaxID=3154492 RepID=UPI0033FA580F
MDRAIYFARESCGATDFKTVVKATLEWMLNERLVDIGYIGNTGFEAWSGTVGERMDRMMTELDAVDWVPFGGSCWMANTALGDAMIESWEEKHPMEITSMDYMRDSER